MALTLPPFQRTLIAAPTLAAVRAASADWEVMLVTILDAILTRMERHGSTGSTAGAVAVGATGASNYPYIESKLSLLTGADQFAPAAGIDEAHDFKSASAIYGWIQGRGLEALVGHARWLPECTVLPAKERSQLEERTRAAVERAYVALEQLRAKQGGHLRFLMSPDGRAFDLDETTRTRRYFTETAGASTMSDLFYVKGLQAAARYLADSAKQHESRSYFRQIMADIESGRFISEGVNFDPKVNRRPVTGRVGHGARMIGLGACALFTRCFAADDEWFDTGCAFVQYILDHHIQLGQLDAAPTLQRFDMFEGTDAAARPWREPDGAIQSDPGHSTEFVGLATKFLFELDKRPHKTQTQIALLAQARAELPGVLLQNFANGFNPSVGGICKLYDLTARKPINADMPWWNLPETLRAAAGVLRFCPDLPADQREQVFAVIQQASNGFFRSFVNANVHLMAYQTVSAQGQPVDVIPATADADPGYHTGLSIIDYLRWLARLK